MSKEKANVPDYFNALLQLRLGFNYNDLQIRNITGLLVSDIRNRIDRNKSQSWACHPNTKSKICEGFGISLEDFEKLALGCRGTISFTINVNPRPGERIERVAKFTWYN